MLVSLSFYVVAVQTLYIAFLFEEAKLILGLVLW